jgi:hypothetical protein
VFFGVFSKTLKIRSFFINDLQKSDTGLLWAICPKKPLFLPYLLGSKQVFSTPTSGYCGQFVKTVFFNIASNILKSQKVGYFKQNPEQRSWIGKIP